MKDPTDRTVLVLTFSRREYLNACSRLRTHGYRKFLPMTDYVIDRSKVIQDAEVIYVLKGVLFKPDGTVRNERLLSIFEYACKFGIPVLSRMRKNYYKSHPRWERKYGRYTKILE